MMAAVVDTPQITVAPQARKKTVVLMQQQQIVEVLDCPCCKVEEVAVWF